MVYLHIIPFNGLQYKKREHADDHEKILADEWARMQAEVDEAMAGDSDDESDAQDSDDGLEHMIDDALNEGSQSPPGAVEQREGGQKRARALSMENIEGSGGKK